MSNMTRLKVGVYCHSPKATTLRFYHCLQTWGFSFLPIWQDELANLQPGDVDVLLLPGGWYGIDRIPPMNQHDQVQNAEHPAMERAVRAYVRAGGGIVGVCCGAYNIVWMNFIKADISRTQGAGMHALEVANERHPVAAGVAQRTSGRKDRKWQATPVVRINGPIFFPKEKSSLVFSYDWEQRLGAVLAGGYGRGRAVAISPHPERTATELSADEQLPLSMEPRMPVVTLLKNSLLWAGHRPPA